MNKIKAFFAKYGTPLLYVVIILTFIARANDFYIFRDFNSDKSRQLHGAYEYQQGFGLSYVSYDLNSFQPKTRPVIDWPPAYSYITLAISSVTGAGMYQSSLYLDYFNLCLLWLTLLWLTNLAGLSRIQQILFFLFIGLSKTPIQPISSSDLIGTTLFLLSCCLNLQFIQRAENGKKATLFFFLAQFLLMFTIIMMKYSLMPALFAIALSVVAYYYNQKQKQYLKTGGLLTAFAVLSLALMFLYNQSVSGQSTGLGERHASDGVLLHFGNLRYFYPFIIDSLFYLGPFGNKLNSNLVNNISATITVLLFLWIAIGIIKKMQSKQARYFDYLALVTMVFVVGFLVLLSLKFKKDEDGPVSWTYVKEYRYYAPAIFLLLIYLFKTYDPFNKENRKTALRFLVLPAVLFAILLKGYYTYVGNRANSFEALYGKVFAVTEEVKKMADKDTYFMSYTGGGMFDSQLTSTVAINGVKVSMSYYSYFPDSTYKVPFSDKMLPAGKKIIVYLDDAKALLDTTHTVNKYTIEPATSGGQFLVFKN